MHGNIWEWCGDTWSANAPPREGDGLRDDGVDGSFLRVARGGCWGDSASGARSAGQFGITTVSRSPTGGVRPSKRITP